MSEIDDLRTRVDDLEARLAAVAERAQRRCLSIDEACAAYEVSRPVFERWLADRSTGLFDVVFQPSGPRGRVLVPVEAFEAWLRKRTQVARRPRRCEP